ncbi:Uncharacterised protein [Mycobacteroides abscessus subsp. massiliense]|nr:Uncharacterised protein [Mycobacteroides abscessus subsp. massiliense]
MVQVVTHVVTHEGQHGHRITPHRADLALGGGRLLRTQGAADEHAVLPVPGLGHQRHRCLATAAEQDCRDRHTLWVIPFGSQDGALRHRSAVPRIRVRRFGLGLPQDPILALPVDQVLRLALQSFPPHVVVVGTRDVGEDGVAGFDGLHGVRVRAPVGARCHTEEAELRVDRVQTAVLAKTHPGDVVTQSLCAPTGNGRLDHGEVGLAAG